MRTLNDYVVVVAATVVVDVNAVVVVITMASKVLKQSLMH